MAVRKDAKLIIAIKPVLNDKSEVAVYGVRLFSFIEPDGKLYYSSDICSELDPTGACRWKFGESYPAGSITGILARCILDLQQKPTTAVVRV